MGGQPGCSPVSNPEPAAPVELKATAARRKKRAWVTLDDLNVASGLLGAALASPWRRLMAIAVNLIVIGLLSTHANFLLLGAIALATWLLVRKRPTDPALRKNGWRVVALGRRGSHAVGGCTATLEHARQHRFRP